MSGEILFHLSAAEAAKDKWRKSERLALFARMAEALEPRGGRIRAIARDPLQMEQGAAAPDGNLHIVENGAMRGEGWLNAGLAYLIGFWHLDPVGIQAASMAGSQRFDPAQMDKRAAKLFARALRDRFVKARLSRFSQARNVDKTLPEGCIAVFLQGVGVYRRGQSVMDMRRMLVEVHEGAGGRPVVVKPHPRARAAGEAAIADLRAIGLPVLVSEANVHDILAACAVTVSVNSAVAMEGFLHRKPAILFGQSDYPTLCEQVARPGDFAAALQRALGRDWEYSLMLAWYFQRHTLELAAPDFEARLLARFADVGFDAGRLGLG